MCACACACACARVRVCACGAHQQVQGLRPGVPALAAGAGAGLRGGGVQEQLVILEGVDQAGHVPQVGLGLLGCHGLGEAPPLMRRRGGVGEGGGWRTCDRVLNGGWDWDANAVAPYRW